MNSTSKQKAFAIIEMQSGMQKPLFWLNKVNKGKLSWRVDCCMLNSSFSKKIMHVNK